MDCDEFFDAVGSEDIRRKVDRLIELERMMLQQHIEPYTQEYLDEEWNKP